MSKSIFPITTDCPRCKGKKMLVWTEVPGNPDRARGHCACWSTGALIEEDTKALLARIRQPRTEIENE